jgi:hypothetical protein
MAKVQEQMTEYMMAYNVNFNPCGPLASGPFLLVEFYLVVWCFLGMSKVIYDSK